MADNLQALEEWVQPLIANLSTARRRKLLRTLAVGIRQRQAKRIASQKNPDGSAYAPRKPRKADKKGRIKRRAALFKEMRKAKHLRIRASANLASVGYTGRTARIARIHQEGQLAEVGKGGPLHQYDRRELLGFTPDDRDWIAQTVHDHLGSQ
ncbi:MAG: phage virion morphogenesis protein [Candidatus Sedimenticola sp. (ex Thyasira tokunagai)]